MGLNESIDLVLSYSSTETFIMLWYDRYKEENLIEKTKEKLKIYNYIVSKLKDKNEYNINQIIKIITQESINKKEKNSLPQVVFYYIVEDIKKRNIEINELNFEEIKNQTLPDYEINDKVYEEMICKVENNYKNTFAYEKRKQASEEFANKGLSSYVSIAGEVLTQLFAQKYIENYTNTKTLEIPEAYKKTKSGKNYIEQVKPKRIKVENKTFLQKMKEILKKV